MVSSSAAAAAAAAVEQQTGNQTPTDPSADTKFTTANFTETVVTPSGSVFGAPPSRPAGAEATGAAGAGTESESTLSAASDLEFKVGLGRGCWMELRGKWIGLKFDECFSSEDLSVSVLWEFVLIPMEFSRL